MSIPAPLPAAEDAAVTRSAAGPAPAPGTRAGHSGRTPIRSWLLYTLVLVMASLTVYGGLIGAPATRVFAENDDTSLFIWWFAHAADVTLSWLGLGSGERDFLYTHAMNHPDGVNGAWNTSVLGLALPMVPVTLLAGPVVSFNLAIMASPVVSALAAAVFVRRFTAFGPACLGGFAYGFSTYVVSQSAGHLNLAFAPFPPLVALGVHLLLDTGIRRRRRVLAIGALLGLVIGWQFFISSELLAGTFLATVVLLAVRALLTWRRFLAGLRSLVLGGATAVVVACLVGTPLLVTMFTHPAAPGAAIRPHGVWNADVFDAVVPGPYTLLGGAPETPIPRALPLDPAEIGGYFGLVWIGLAVVTCVALWSHPRWKAPVRVTAVTGLLMWLLSMGAPLRVWGQELPSTAPFRLVELVPVLQNVLPMRLVVHATLAMSLLLAFAVQAALDSGNRRLRFAGVGAALLALVLVFPGTVPTRPVYVPEFFTSGAYREVLPEGSVTKVLPAPMAAAQPHTAEAMAWQAVSGMHYVDTGGYFIGGTDDGGVVYSAPDDALDRILEEEALPAGDSAEVRAALVELRSEGVEYLLVADNAWYLSHPAEDVARMVAEAAGLSYHKVDGVFLVDLTDAE